MFYKTIWLNYSLKFEVTECPNITGLQNSDKHSNTHILISVCIVKFLKFSNEEKNER